MQSQFLAAINQLCEEKNLPKDTIMETIKAAIRAAYRKDYGNKEQEIEIEINEKSGSISVLLVKEIVKKVEDINLQLSLKEALKYKKSVKIGDKIKIDVTPLEYGRIAAQSAKQVIIQRLQEAERDKMYETFKDRENELISAIVHRVENKQVYINLEKISTILLPEQQIPGERYYGGQRLRLYLDKVIKTTKGPQLLISRTHPSLVRKLMELEIPEIKNGMVEIKNIAREPGIRTKISVSANDSKIDPIGSCVGQKGVRIQNVMDELNNERIDIIKWSKTIEEYIKASLAPAKVANLVINEKERRAKVYVNPDQRPLAIGKNGQNVRLASILTEYEIDILDVNDLKTAKEKTEEEKPKASTIEELNLPEEIIEKLKTANLTLVSQLKGLKVKDLTEIEGIGEKNAKIIVSAVKKVE